MTCKICKIKHLITLRVHLKKVIRLIVLGLVIDFVHIVTELVSNCEGVLITLTEVCDRNILRINIGYKRTCISAAEHISVSHKVVELVGEAVNHITVFISELKKIDVIIKKYITLGILEEAVLGYA